MREICKFHAHALNPSENLYKFALHIEMIAHFKSLDVLGEAKAGVIVGNENFLSEARRHHVQVTLHALTDHVAAHTAKQIKETRLRRIKQLTTTGVRK